MVVYGLDVQRPWYHVDLDRPRTGLEAECDMRAAMAAAGIGLMAATMSVELRSSAQRDISTGGRPPGHGPVEDTRAAYWGWVKPVLRDFESRDLNADRRLSKDELTLQGGEFADLDSDEDGYISPQELRRYHRRLRRPG